MIEQIKEKLKEIDERVLYGVCKKGDTWDCFLVRKERIEKNGTSQKDYARYFSVRVIREDEIPEGIEMEVIRKLEEIGLKKSHTPISYEYTVDANEVVVEICSIEFVKREKRMC